MRPLAWQFKAATLAAVVAVPVWRGATRGGATSAWVSTSEWPGQVRREGPTRTVCCMVFTALAQPGAWAATLQLRALLEGSGILNPRTGGPDPSYLRALRFLRHLASFVCLPSSSIA